MGQHIYFGAMCDITANNDYTDYKNTDYMDIICHIEHTGYVTYNILGIQMWFSHKSSHWVIDCSSYNQYFSILFSD